MYSSQEPVVQHSVPDNTAIGPISNQRGLNESMIASLKSEVNELSETVKLLTKQVQMLTAALGLTFDATGTTGA